jgi:hypothetical protein
MATMELVDVKKVAADAERNLALFTMAWLLDEDFW